MASPFIAIESYGCLHSLNNKQGVCHVKGIIQPCSLIGIGLFPMGCVYLQGVYTPFMEHGNIVVIICRLNMEVVYCVRTFFRKSNEKSKFREWIFLGENSHPSCSHQSLVIRDLYRSEELRSFSYQSNSGGLRYRYATQVLDSGSG